MQLRPYQIQAIEQTLAKLAIDDSVMLQLSTGGGKTVIMGEIVRRCVLKNYPVLILAHREELLTQPQDKFFHQFGIYSGIIQGGRPKQLSLPVQIASVATFVGMVRKGFQKQFKVIIVDEAHHCEAETYIEIIEAYPGAKLIGLTATPYRLDGTGFTERFKSLVQVITVKELESQGFLIPADMFVNKMDTSGLKVKKGEYDAAQVGAMLSEYQVLADMVQSWRDHANGKKTICFASTIEQSNLIVEYFNTCGIPSAHVDGSSKNREQIFKDLKSGKILMVSNVGIATEGFDEPSVECVMLLRKTKSLSLYLQMVGRGSRPFTNKTTGVKKEVYTLLDFADNWVEHGLPNDEIDWEAYFKGSDKKKKKKKDKEEDEDGKQYVLKLDDGKEVTVKLSDMPKDIRGVSLVRIIKADRKTIKTKEQKIFDSVFNTTIRLKHKPYAAFYRWRERMMSDEREPTIEDFFYVAQMLNLYKYWAYDQKDLYDKELKSKTDIQNQVAEQAA